MKIKKLTKRLLKEYDVADGFVRIDSVATDYSDDMRYTTIKGVFGRTDADGTIHQTEFELFFPDGYKNNIEYLAGMFAQTLLDIENK